MRLHRSGETRHAKGGRRNRGWPVATAIGLPGAAHGRGIARHVRAEQVSRGTGAAVGNRTSARAPPPCCAVGQLLPALWQQRHVPSFAIALEAMRRELAEEPCLRDADAPASSDDEEFVGRPILGGKACCQAAA